MIDRDYPRLTNLSLPEVRARVSEVKEANLTQHAPTEPRPTDRRETPEPVSTPAAPRQSSLPLLLPLGAPAAINHAPTITPERPSPIEKPATALPSASPQPAEREPLLDVRQASPPETAIMPRSAPGVDSPAAPVHVPTLDVRPMTTAVEHVDRSRIVWRDGPQTR